MRFNSPGVSIHHIFEPRKRVFNHESKKPFRFMKISSEHPVVAQLYSGGHLVYEMMTTSASPTLDVSLHGSYSFNKLKVTRLRPFKQRNQILINMYE